MVKTGIRCTIEYPEYPHGHPVTGKVATLLPALLLYAAVCGVILSMAGLERGYLTPLTFGGGFLVLLILLPEKGAKTASAAAAVLIAAYFLFAWAAVFDGGKLLLNRFFAASERQEAYTYFMLPVSPLEDGWPGHICAALVPLGTVAAVICALAARLRWKWLTVGLFLAFSIAAAYLGVMPSTAVCVLAALALGWNLQAFPGRGVLVGAILGGVAATVILLFPGEAPALSTWEESARDALALHTVAYADFWKPDTVPPQQTPQEQFYHEDETNSELNGDETAWTVHLPLLLLILAVTLILFVPSFLSDWRQKRVKAWQAGFANPDRAAAIRAMFGYMLSWLRLRGMKERNSPYSAYAHEVEVLLSDAYGSSYQQAVLLWQEAAYSSHAMTDAQCDDMRRIMKETQTLVWNSLGYWKRLLARYRYALI